VRRIRERLAVTAHRSAIEIIERWAVRLGDLQQAPIELQPQIVHFSGHGTTEYELMLEGDDGSPRPVGKPKSILSRSSASICGGARSAAQQLASGSSLQRRRSGLKIRLQGTTVRAVGISRRGSRKSDDHGALAQDACGRSRDSSKRSAGARLYEALARKRGNEQPEHNAPSLALSPFREFSR
jgi:hypothetical protein